MTVQNPHELIKLLANDLRWHLVRILSNGDYRVGELVSLVGQPLNLVSYHLKQLRDFQLVTARRSDADGRDTYYSLNLDELQQAFQSAGATIHPVLGQIQQKPKTLSRKPKVLFLCTHNSARSQMAEGLLRAMSDGQLTVKSAGSIPSVVHPQAIRIMDDMGINIQDQYSKGFDDVLDESFDVIITVCDHAREVCPTFPYDAQHIHWGLSDPASIKDQEEQHRAFAETAQRLQIRIEYFLQTL